MAYFKIEFCSLGLPYICFHVHKDNKLKGLVQLCPSEIVFYYCFNPLSSLSEIMSGFLDLFYKTVGLVLQAWKPLDLEIKLYVYFIQEKKKEIAILFRFPGHSVFLDISEYLSYRISSCCIRAVVIFGCYFKNNFQSSVSPAQRLFISLEEC